MSASGTGPFENDLALDFCDELQGLDAEQVVAAFRNAFLAAAETPAGAYLDRSVGEPAVAAAALAIAKSKEHTEVLEGVELASVIPPIPTELWPHAIAALERTLEADSEARRLWEQSGAESEWVSTLESFIADARSLRDG